MGVVVGVAQLVGQGVQEQVAALGVQVIGHPLEDVHGRCVHDRRSPRLHLPLRLHLLHISHQSLGCTLDIPTSIVCEIQGLTLSFAYVSEFILASLKGKADVSSPSMESAILDVPENKFCNCGI